jgi:hypothetical protein
MAEDMGGRNGDNKTAPNNDGLKKEPKRPVILRPNQETYKSRRNPDPPNWVEKWTLIVLVLTFFAACYAGYEADRLATDTETTISRADSAAETQHLDTLDVLARSDIANQLSGVSMLLSERAWVAPIEAVFTKPPAINSIVAAVVQYQNTGRLPATDLAIAQDMRYVATYRVRGSYGFKPPRIKSCENLLPMKDGETVFPSQRTIYTTGIPPEKALLYRDTLQQKSEVLVWQGCCAYRTFAQPHKSRFCFWLRPQDKAPISDWVWNFCSTGNSAD